VAGTVENVSVRAGATVTVGQVLAKVDNADAAEAVDNAQDALDDANDALAEARENASSSSATSSTTTCGQNVAAAYATEVSQTATYATNATGGTAAPTPTGSTAAPTPTGSTATPTPTRTTATPTPTATRIPVPARTTTAPASRTGGGNAGSRGDTGGGTCTGSGEGRPGDSQGGGSDAILSAEQRVTQASTTLENAEAALAGATITAPIAGRVLSVSGKVGSLVNAGSAFITLADVFDMEISADFPEADADRLAIKQTAVVTLADREGEEFRATVVQVDPVGTSDGTMVRYGVLLSFDESPEGLLVGQSAAVRVTTGAKADVLRVPTAAVHDVAGTFGTVMRGGTQVRVTVGLRGDQYTEVSSGLSEGDEVVRSW
jgi:HlyD family secretion protein